MTTRTPTFEILLAEDNAADVMLVRTALAEQQIDCALHVMKDGAQAIAFIEKIDADRRQRPLDLLLLDMHLPKHDGEDILKRLRSTERNAQTPVIVMTASDSPRDKEKAQKHAALHYFKKPSDLSEFMQLGDIIRDILAATKSRGPSASGGERSTP